MTLLGSTTLAQTTWTGNKSTDWNDDLNWNTTSIPTASDDVVIPSGTTRKPILSTSAEANSVEIESGASLTITPTGSLTIYSAKDVNSKMTAFYNAGTVENSGQLLIGSINSAGLYGLWNPGSFTNHMGGQISIDQVDDTGLYNFAGTFANSGTIIIGGDTGLWNTGTFTNNLGGQISLDKAGYSGLLNQGMFTNYASITVRGNTSSTGIDYGLLYNDVTFNNNPGGQINLDDARIYGLLNNASGVFINSATITIGATGTGGEYPIQNAGSFTNTAGGQISIDNAGHIGLLNDGTFTNSAKITVGAIASVGEYGLVNRSIFTNDPGGEISTDNTYIYPASGVYNAVGTFTNKAKITIGAIASVGDFGLRNDATFDNSAGGYIRIDNATDTGLYNYSLTFTNSATIIIGATSSVGNSSIRNNATFDNTGCAALLDVFDEAFISNIGTFNNTGLIIKHSGGYSNISSNEGIVHVLNGSEVDVETGPNQPLSLTTTNPTTCNATNGSITISGVKANTSYTLSYTAGGNATTINLVSDGSGQLFINDLGGGVYSIALSGTCLPQTLLLAATLTSPGGPALPPAAILSLTADESGCPVRLQGQATGTSFIFTGPNGYVFSNVYRTGGTYSIFADGIKKAGVYTLIATYADGCGISIPVSQTVTVSRNCL